MQTESRIVMMQDSFSTRVDTGDPRHPIEDIILETLNWVLGNMSTSEFFDAFEHAFECVEEDKTVASRQSLDLAHQLGEALRNRVPSLINPARIEAEIAAVKS